MTPQQREAALRLADSIENGGMADDVICALQAAALLRELAQEPQAECEALREQLRIYEERIVAIGGIAMNSIHRSSLKDMPCGCRIGECETKKAPYRCRMNDEVALAEPQAEPVGYMPEKALENLRSGVGPIGVWPTANPGDVPLYAHPPQRKPLKAGELWSWVRSVMSQGADIRVDYDMGNHKGYEAYSARLDAAASERADEFAAAHGITEAP